MNSVGIVGVFVHLATGVQLNVGVYVGVDEGVEVGVEVNQVPVGVGVLVAVGV